MDKKKQIRKDEHIKYFDKTYSVYVDKDFTEFKLIRPTLPEINSNDVDLKTTIFNKKISAPIYINAMTGGTSKSKEINDSLSRIANHLNIGFALGSGSILFDEDSDKSSFTIARENNKNGLVIANINVNSSISQIKQLIDITKCDAIQIHVNSVQEIVMKEGDRDFKWLHKIENIIKQIDKPVIIKEVGFGFDKNSFIKLKKIGAKYIDVGGTSGTNFVKIEEERKQNFNENYLEDIGLSTIKSLLNGKDLGFDLFASGGITNPLDAFKCLVLGSKAIGLSGIVLKKLLNDGEKECENYLKEFINNLKNIFVLYGVKNINETRNVEYYLTGNLFKYAFQILRK